MDTERLHEADHRAAQARPRPARSSTAGRIVYVAAGLWGLGFAVAAVVRYSLFLDRRYDLGNFTQAVWTTAHGHLLEVTEVGGAQVSRLGIHVDPIVILFAPLWWIWPSPALLLVVQALALGFGAFPLFWLARKHLRTEHDAAAIALSYLLYPTVAANALFEFHALSLTVPLLLLTIWFMDEGRLAPAGLTAIGAMASQEQIGLIVVCVGLWYAWRRRQLRAGLALSALGLLATAVDLATLRHFAGGSPFVGRYREAGGSLGSIARNIIVHPLRVARTFHRTDLVDIVVLAVPVLGLCFTSTFVLAAAPQAALLVLNDNPVIWRISAQNVLPLIPFIYAASVFALGRRETTTERNPWAIRPDYILVVSFVFAIFGPFAPLNLTAMKWPDSARVNAQRHAIGLVPADARVAATNHLGSHLAARRFVYVFPVTKQADWVVIDTSDAFLPNMSDLYKHQGKAVGLADLYWQPTLMLRTLRRLERDPEWREIYTASTVHVLQRQSRR